MPYVFQATEFRLGGDENLRSWSIDNFLLTKKLEERFLQDDSVLFFLDIELLGKQFLFLLYFIFLFPIFLI